jgi:hypothetical protein
VTLPVDASMMTAAAVPTSDKPVSDRVRRMAEGLPQSRPLSRGYDKVATQALIDRVCVMLDDLTNQMHVQRVDLEAAWAELTARRTGYLPDNSMTGPGADMLVNIQRSAMMQSDDVMRAAGEQGALVVEAAKAQAAELIAAAHAQAGIVDARTRHRLDEVMQVANSLLESVSRSADVLGEAHNVFRGELDRIAGQAATVRPDSDSI